MYSELRDGDYVLYKDGDKYIPVIYSILDGSFTLEALDNREIYDFNPTNLKGIPITKELLMSNGWEEIDENIYRLDDNPTLGIEAYPSYGSDDSYNDVYVVGSNESKINIHCIRYLHELQHILWAFDIDDYLEVFVGKN